MEMLRSGMLEIAHTPWRGSLPRKGAHFQQCLAHHLTRLLLLNRQPYVTVTLPVLRYVQSKSRSKGCTVNKGRRPHSNYV